MDGYAHANARPGKTGLSGRIAVAGLGPSSRSPMPLTGHALALDDNLQLAAHALRAATALETADYCDFGSDLHRHALICSAALRLGVWTIFRASLSLVATYSRWFRLDLSLSLLALGGAFFFCCSPFRSIFSLALGQTRSWTIPILNSRKKVKTTKAQKHCRLL